MSTYLMRMLRNSSNWADLLEDASWSEEDCPSEVLFQLYDTKGDTEGVSYWQLRGTREELSEQIKTIVAGHQVGRGGFSEVSVVYIEESIIEKLGIVADGKHKGENLVKSVKDKHRDLKGISAKKLVQLASEVKKAIQAGQFISVSQYDVENKIASIFNDPDFDKANLSKKADALAKLLKNGYFAFAVQSAAPSVPVSPASAS